ncbi:MAG: coproporphyrinogen III oxidase, partial [Bacteroidota bacterium]
MNSELVKKYNVPVPRYTSYPTVPYWDKEKPGSADWQIKVKSAFKKSKEISLYIHLPYCEKLGTYCGCNIRI